MKNNSIAQNAAMGTATTIKLRPYKTVNGTEGKIKIEKVSTYDYRVKDTNYFADAENADIYLDNMDIIKGKIALYYFRVYNKVGRKWMEED